MTITRSAARRLFMSLGLCAAATCCTGCQTIGDLANVPLEMAEHAAVEAAKFPYETAKVGVRALADAVSDTIR